jgi:membrane fusion protein (multidrug efflux system)
MAAAGKPDGDGEGQDDQPKTRDPRSYSAEAGTSGGGGSDDRSDDMEGKDDKDQGSLAPKGKGLLHRPVTLTLLIGGVLLAVLLVILYWLHARNYQTTDDAFIDTHLIRLAPQISGRVQTVLVEDNQRVAAGQTVIQIDPRDEEAKVSQAQAQRAQADAQIAQAQAQVAQTAAQVDVARATYAQDLASEASAAAQATNAARDFARYQALKQVNPAAVSTQQLDQAQAQASSTAAQRDAAARQAQGAKNQIDAARAQIAAAQAQIAAGQAQRANADATIRSAQLDLGYTKVVAPEAGTVAQRSVAVGTYLNAGAQIMAIVPLKTWVTANFKETQLDLMRPGQPVQVHVDACPHADVEGHVDSIQRGSGQAFGVLPPENATGNFVKVVQRVPVKIVIDGAPRDCPLGPGLSVEPRVRVR